VDEAEVACGRGGFTLCRPRVCESVSSANKQRPGGGHRVGRFSQTRYPRLRRVRREGGTRRSRVCVALGGHLLRVRVRAAAHARRPGRRGSDQEGKDGRAPAVEPPGLRPRGHLGTEQPGSTRESRNPQPSELRFRALLTNGDVRMLSIARRTSSSVGFDWEAGNLGAKRHSKLPSSRASLPGCTRARPSCPPLSAGRY
jgi:hypothetical protein